MRAIRCDRYGPPDVLRLADVPMPAVGDDDVLVQVRAASVNPLDFHFMRGTPYLVRLQSGLARPRNPGLGADMAGVVTEVGKNVSSFQPGDEVFGGRSGTLAEYVSLPRNDVIAAKPARLTFEQAGAVGVAGFTALQAVRDKALVQPGQRVLVNGASGGVGTFAIQLAKWHGAEVTGVCSARNVDLVKSLGADHVIDYTREDFTKTGDRYDAVIDMAGTPSLAERRRVLVPGGVLVAVGGPEQGDWIAPLAGLAGMLVRGMFSRQRLVPFLARQRRDDLLTLADLINAGDVTPVIDRTYPLAEAADAIRYLEEGHARGKVVVTM